MFQSTEFRGELTLTEFQISEVDYRIVKYQAEGTKVLVLRIVIVNDHYGDLCLFVSSGAPQCRGRVGGAGGVGRHEPRQHLKQSGLLPAQGASGRS